MSAFALLVSSALGTVEPSAASAELVDVQTPRSLEEPAAEAGAQPVADPVTAVGPNVAAEADGASSEAAAQAQPVTPDPSSAVPATEEPTEPGGDEVLTVAEGSRGDGPPYYTQQDAAKLRTRFGLHPNPAPGTRTARWKCLIADPVCGINFELNATGAYAMRVRQGNVSNGETRRWNSGRAQYDFWLNFPTLVETVGRARFTRMTLGPKGGVIVSDTGDLWGNVGVAMRYWFGRGRWAPTLELTSALSYKIGSRPTTVAGLGTDSEFRLTRGPVGFSADIGFGLGGFGALIVGGQYDSPLAREDIPETERVSASGMFFVGFRGNIVWGGPAAAAILTHGLTQRLVER